MSEPKIGDKLAVHGYRGQVEWVPVQSESRTHWHLGHNYRTPIKVPKKAGPNDEPGFRRVRGTYGSRTVWLDTAAYHRHRSESEWLAKWRWKIQRAVETASYDQHRLIAAIVLPEALK